MSSQPPPAKKRKRILDPQHQIPKTTKEIQRTNIQPQNQNITSQPTKKIDRQDQKKQVDQQHQHPSRLSPEIEIIHTPNHPSSTRTTISQQTRHSLQLDHPQIQQDSLPSLSDMLPSKPQPSPTPPANPLNTSSIISSEPVQSDLIKRSLVDLFRFLILDGPEFSSVHIALQKMAQSAQACLEEEPDETIYQTELEEKNVQLKSSEDQLEQKLIQVVDPIVQDLSHFIQSHLVREIEKGKKQVAQNQSVKKAKNLEEIQKLESKLSTQQNHQIDSISTKIQDIQARLARLESHLGQSTQVPASNLSHLHNPLPQPTLVQNIINSPGLNQPSPEIVKTPITNELKLSLSPTTMAPPHPSRPVPAIQLQPSSQSHPKIPGHPQTTAHRSPATTTTTTLEPSSPVVNSSVRPPANHANSNQIGIQQRPHPLTIPSRSSLDLGRQPHPSSDNASESPVHSTAALHSSTLPCPNSASSTSLPFFSRTQLEDIYNYISNRLMKSSWFQDYSKSRLTDIFKQHFHQDLGHSINSHLNQLGLNSGKITDILNLLNLLPDLDLNFLQKRKHLHPPSQPQPLQKLVPIMSTFNISESMSITELKEILLNLKLFSQDSNSRIDRSEIKLANVEKLGLADHGNLLALTQRMELVETQGSQLSSIKMGSDELYNLELRIQSAQREAMDILRDEMAMKTQATRPPQPPSASPPPPPPVIRSNLGNNHPTDLTLARIEHHILNRLVNGIPSSDEKVGNVQIMKENEGGGDPSEREEGEAVDDDEDDQPNENKLLDQPSRNRAYNKFDELSLSPQGLNLKNKEGWSVFFDFLKVIEDRSKKLEQQSRTLDHHHHHHHQHRHQVQMVLGINQESVNSIDFLQVNRSVERQVATNHSAPSQSLGHDQNNSGSTSN